MQVLILKFNISLNKYDLLKLKLKIKILKC